MRKYTLLRGAVLMLMVGIMAGCATAPTQEMSDARQAVQAAKEAGAAAHAPGVMGNAEQQLSEAERALRGRNYESARDGAVAARQEALKARNMTLALNQAKDAVAEAEQLGAASPAAHEWLAKLEAASAAGNEEEALRAGQEAKQQARDDIKHFREQKLREEKDNQEWLDKSKPLLDEARQAETRLNSLQQEALHRAEEAYQQQNGQRAYNLISVVTAELHAPPPPPPPPPPVESKPRTLNYQVMKGDSLWTIARKPSVYGDPRRWPLIYRSNQAHIRNPDVLPPGLTLLIELEPSADLVKLAAEHARRREGAPDAVKKLDKQFLLDAK